MSHARHDRDTTPTRHNWERFAHPHSKPSALHVPIMVPNDPPTVLTDPDGTPICLPEEPSDGL